VTVLALHQNSVKTQQFHGYAKDVVRNWQDHISDFFFADDLLFSQGITCEEEGATNYNKVWSLAKKRKEEYPTFDRLLTF